MENEPVDDVKIVDKVVVIHDKVTHSMEVVSRETKEEPVKP